MARTGRRPVRARTSPDGPTTTSPRRRVTLTPLPGALERSATSWLLQPFVDLVLVVRHPVGAGLFGILLVAGDCLRDELLILVGELHLLQHVICRRATVRELLREQLVDHRDV